MLNLNHSIAPTFNRAGACSTSRQRAKGIYPRMFDCLVHYRDCKLGDAKPSFTICSSISLNWWGTSCVWCDSICSIGLGCSHRRQSFGECPLISVPYESKNNSWHTWLFQSWRCYIIWKRNKWILAISAMIISTEISKESLRSFGPQLKPLFFYT